MRLPSVLAEQLTGQQRASSASLWRWWCWRKAPFRIAIAFSISYALIASSGDRTLAQLVPDTTLGGENSRVTPITPTVDQINGGATRGVNLFHSFQEFNVGNGRSVYFTNLTGIENILTRVTGTNASNILGTLGVAGGNANLFLINPNGIIFGLNARLDVGGSFVATTANAVGFGTQGFFSASAPNVPPLLTVNPSAFLFNQIAAAPIINQSVAQNPTNPLSIDGLRVPYGQSLLLAGGNVNLEGGFLKAPGGRVELGGLSGTGTLGLSMNGNDLRLSFPLGVPRADVSITNGAEVNVRAGGGGSIAINAQNLNMTGGSILRAGIDSGMGSVYLKAGDIDVNTTLAITLTNGFIGNVVLRNVSGKGGNVNITTGSLSVTNGSQVVAVTRGQGNAGSVNILAHDTVSFDGVDSNGFPSAAFSSVEATGVGNGGDINITTGSLAVTNGAQLLAATRGRGNAGSINIFARDTISFDGVGSNKLSSAALSSVEATGVGNGGNINITTGLLAVTNGAQLVTSTRGKGNAGSINIVARDTISFDGVGSNGLPSALFSAVTQTGVGNGGNINITTGLLAVTNDAQLVAATRGKGNAGSINIVARDTVFFDGSNAFSSVTQTGVGNGGNINITTGSLVLTRGAELVAATEGQGNAGNVNIVARDTVAFDGVDSNGLSSTAFSSVEATGVGSGGNINITTGSLAVTNGAQLQARTKGQGDAGNVNIVAHDTVSFDGVDSNGFPSGAFSSVTQTGVGNGGNINITTGSLSVTNGVQLVASTQGQGNAGSITITARDTVSFDESAAFSTVEPGAVGKGGGINITTGSLSVTNSAALTSSSNGQGDAGDIFITARDILLNNQATIQAQTLSGNGGNITLNVQDLLLMRRNSLISTTAGTAGQGGDGGNMNTNAQFIVAVPKEDSDITADAFTGRGGNINITTQGIYGLQYRPQRTPLSDITASSQFGVNGTVQINTPGIDPSRGLANLPENLVDTSALIANSCIARSSQQGGSFTITGRGGLPTRPGDPFTSPYPTGTVRSLPSTSASNNTPGSDLEATNPEHSQPRRVAEPINGVRQSSQAQNHPDTASSHTSTPPTPAPLVEASGWMYGANGEVILTAQSPTVTPHSSWSTRPTCPE